MIPTQFKYAGLIVWLFTMASCSAATQANTSGISAQQISGDIPLFADNDLSILFPLNAASQKELIDLNDGLIDQPTYDKVRDAAAANFSGSPLNDLAGLKVVGIRLDHCFKTQATNPNCQPQIRIVAQRVHTDPVSGELSTPDAAVHLLYNLDNHTFRKALLGIWTLRLQHSDLLGDDTNFDTLGLGIHPLLSQDPSTLGVFGTKLMGVVKSVIDWRNQLAHIAFATVGDPANEVDLPGINDTHCRDFRTGTGWLFVGVDVHADADNKLQPQLAPIAGIAIPPDINDPEADPAVSKFQVMFAPIIFPAQADSVQGIFAGSCPPPAPEFAQSLMINDPIDTDEERRLFDEVTQTIQDPTRVMPADTDCASCHMSTPIGVLIRKQRFPFVGAARVQESSAMTTQTSLRCFGYEQIETTSTIEPMICEHTANSTGLIKKALNENEDLQEERREIWLGLLKATNTIFFPLVNNQ